MSTMDEMDSLRDEMRSLMPAMANGDDNAIANYSKLANRFDILAEQALAAVRAKRQA